MEVSCALEMDHQAQDLYHQFESSLFVNSFNTPKVDETIEETLSDLFKIANLSFDRSLSTRAIEKRLNFDEFLGNAVDKLYTPTTTTSVVPVKKRPLLMEEDCSTPYSPPSAFRLLRDDSEEDEKEIRPDIPTPGGMNSKLPLFIKAHEARMKKLRSEHENCPVRIQQFQGTIPPKLEPEQTLDDLDDDTLQQLGETVTFIESMYFPNSHNKAPQSSESSSKDSRHGSFAETCIPLRPQFFYNVFTSTEVEKAVYENILARMPPPPPAKSPRVLDYTNNRWVDHRTFALSMQVYGSISPHVMNIMGVAVMEEQFWKDKANLLPPQTWSRHIVRCDLAGRFQDPEMNPSNISNMLIEPRQGYKLDIMDLVFLPLHTSGFWYLIVANFRDNRFEVFCPNEKTDSVKNDAETVVWNFQRTFKLAYPRSIRVNIFDMKVVYCSVSDTRSHNDSGVFIMQLFQKYDGNTHLYFKPAHAKTIREKLAFYLIANKHNQVLKRDHEVKDILSSFNVNVWN